MQVAISHIRHKGNRSSLSRLMGGNGCVAVSIDSYNATANSSIQIFASAPICAIVNPSK